MSVIEVSANYGGRVLTLQTGKFAKQADASVLAKYGETMVLVTVVSGRKLGAEQDFFPLTVDYQERYYSAGRLPGGFFKREAKPSDRATLSARLIDRPCRPLFPEDYLYETNVVATVLSIDGINEPDYLASIAASAALHISDIPWSGPIGTVRVGYLNDQLVINPSPVDMAESKLDLLVSGVKTGVVMVEGSAKEVSEKHLMDAIDFAHNEMKVVFDLQDELRAKAGKEKRTYDKPLRDEALKADIKKLTWGSFEKAFSIRQKLERYEALRTLSDKVKEKFQTKEPKNDAEKKRNKLVNLYFEEVKASYAREKTVDTKIRIDGRPFNEIRPISCEVGLLPRVHGSALFTRGETQVLSTITLGTADDEQKIDSISGVYNKSFLLHYNFPPFSVGEARPLRPPGRREIGHGFLAERALTYIIPAKEQFPYTIRIVSEVLESNGSSSMATVCSGSLALMDAGVPVPKPVAGVAMGLIKEGEKIAILSDILGDEDHLGDMDFKVCGTADGVTAFQMDLKIGGVSRDIMESALDQAREGRIHILSKMAEALTTARANFSQYAPRIFTLQVKPDKVREVIGSGGKVIRSIIERTGVKIDIEDDGVIHIASVDEASAQRAIDIIKQIIEEPEPGKIYEGKITRIADFGAFVEIIPGTEGLCHISELEHFRVRQVTDVVKMGDIIQVKCLEVDPSGKIRLSRKALLPKEAEAPAAPRSEGAVVNTAGSEEENRGNRSDASSDRGERPRLDRDRGPDRGPRRDHSGGGRGGFQSGGRDRGDFDRGRGPDRSENRGPDRNENRGPDRNENRGPDRNENRGPDRNENRGPDRNENRGPDRSENRGPDRDRGPRDRGNRDEPRRFDKDDRGGEDRNTRREPDDRGFNGMDDDRGGRFGRNDED